MLQTNLTEPVHSVHIMLDLLAAELLEYHESGAFRHQAAAESEHKRENIGEHLQQGRVLELLSYFHGQVPPFRPSQS